MVRWQWSRTPQGAAPVGPALPPGVLQRLGDWMRLCKHFEAAAALLENGATVTMVMRRPAPCFTPVPSGRPRTLQHRLRYPRTVVGEGWLNYSLQHVPLWPHFLPERMRISLTRRHLGPYATWWLREVESRVSLATRSTISPSSLGAPLQLRDGETLPPLQPKTFAT